MRWWWRGEAEEVPDAGEDGGGEAEGGFGEEVALEEVGFVLEEVGEGAGEEAAPAGPAGLDGDGEVAAVEEAVLVVGAEEGRGSPPSLL